MTTIQPTRHPLRPLLLVATLTASLVVTSTADAQHEHGGDIILQVIDGKIVTGSVDDHGFEPNRTFASELGELIPNETDEPGFDNSPGTFGVGTSIQFSILDALRKWNGLDFSTIPDESIGIAFGSSLGPISTPTTPSVVEGFALNVSNDGDWHRHYDFLLSAPASDGVYLLQLQLASSDVELSPSDPFFIVFNQNDIESNHDAAIDYVQTTIVPEPSAACLGLGAIFGLGLVRRRR